MSEHDLGCADGRGTHEPEEYPRWKHLVLAGVVCLTILAIGTVAFAKTVLVNNGLICDTVEQLTEAVEGVRPTQSAFNDVEGCGYVMGVVPATITPLATYETEHATFLIGRLDFHNHIGTQYGYLGYTLKEPEVGA